MHVPVHLAAMGCLTALGDLDGTMSGLRRGVVPFGPGPAWAPADLPVALVHGDLDPLDRHRTFALAKQVLVLARQQGLDLDPEGLAVVFATTTSAMLAGEAAIEERVSGRPVTVPVDLLVSHLAHQPAESVGEWLGARGPRLVVSTACTSGTVAFGIAADLLRAGRCRRALVVGADALCRTTVYGFRSLGAHTRTACRPFDVERDGMAIGEGAAFALLELGEGALELVGVASRTDAHHLTAPEPGGGGLVRAIRAAVGGADADAIDHVNAHATGTPTNDGVEAAALRVAAPSAWVSATKGATGHTLGAAGVVEAVLLAESMRRGVIPPSTGCRAAVDGVAVALAERTRVQRLGVSVNLAFGGHNAALALRYRGASPGAEYTNELQHPEIARTETLAGPHLRRSPQGLAEPTSSAVSPDRALERRKVIADAEARCAERRHRRAG